MTPNGKLLPIKLDETKCPNQGLHPESTSRLHTMPHTLSQYLCLQVMVANVRCEEIMLERLKLLKEDERWLQLSKSAGSQLVADFGQEATDLLKTCLSGQSIL